MFDITHEILHKIRLFRFNIRNYYLGFKSLKEDKRCEGTLRIHSPRKAILDHVDGGDGCIEELLVVSSND